MTFPVVLRQIGFLVFIYAFTYGVLTFFDWVLVTPTVLDHGIILAWLMIGAGAAGYYASPWIHGESKK